VEGKGLLWVGRGEKKRGGARTAPPKEQGHKKENGSSDVQLQQDKKHEIAVDRPRGKKRSGEELRKTLPATKKKMPRAQAAPNAADSQPAKGSRSLAKQVGEKKEVIGKMQKGELPPPTGSKKEESIIGSSLDRKRNHRFRLGTKRSQANHQKKK